MPSQDLPVLTLADLPEYVRQAVALDEQFLTEDLQRLPGDIAWIGANAAEATRRASLAALERDELAAELDSEVRQKMQDNGGKITEATVKAKIATDPRMKTAERALIDAEREAARLKQYSFAISAKRDSALVLGRLKIAEMAGDPSVRDQQRVDRAFGGK